MARTNFTPGFIQNPTPRPKTGARLIRDAKGNGLALKITPNGPRSFVFVWNVKTVGGDYLEKRVEVAKWSPAANLTKLRSTALEMRERVKAGLTPTATSGLTVSDLWDMYLAHFKPKKRASTITEDERLAKNFIIPEFGMRAPESITRPEVVTLHHKITTGKTEAQKPKAAKKGKKPAPPKGTPSQANRVLALLRHMLNFAINDLELFATKNPCARVAMNEEKRRETFLTEKQLMALWLLLDGFENQEAADAIKLAMVTGCRRREVLGACFSEFDLKGATWKVPAERDKAKRGKTIMLPRAAIEVVLSRRTARAKLEKDDPRRESPYLFSESGDAPLVDLKRPWAEVRAKFGMPALRFHDLRHSFASVLINRGHSLYVVGKALGHSQAATTQKYAHLTSETLVRAAADVGSLFAKPKKQHLKDAAE